MNKCTQKKCSFADCIHFGEHSISSLCGEKTKWGCPVCVNIIGKITGVNFDTNTITKDSSTQSGMPLSDEKLIQINRQLKEYKGDKFEHI